MKTALSIKVEIEQNKKQMSEKDITKRVYNKLAKKNDELRTLLMYLETEPNEIFLNNEKERLKCLILKKESQYNYWSSTVCPDYVEVKKRRALFNKELGIIKLKNQLKVITYLLT